MKVLMWASGLPFFVAGWLVGMVALSGKPQGLLVIAAVIAVPTFIAMMFALRFYVQGGAKGAAPEWRTRA